MHSVCYVLSPMRSVIIQRPSAFVKFLDMVRGNKGVRWSHRSVFCLTVLIEKALWVMESLISTWSTEPPPPLRHGRLYKTSDGHAMAKRWHVPFKPQFTLWVLQYYYFKKKKNIKTKCKQIILACFNRSKKFHRISENSENSNIF